MTHTVILVNGMQIDVDADDWDEAVLAAGERVGQDIGHLIYEIEGA